MYDSYAVDPADIAADAFARRQSVSGTTSCRGCSDPQCGYCDDILEAAHDERVAIEYERVLRSDTELLVIFDNLIAGGNGHRVADMIRLALDRDDLAAGDIARELLAPRVSELAERWAA